MDGKIQNGLSDNGVDERSCPFFNRELYMRNFIFGIATVLITLLLISLAGEILIRGYHFLRNYNPSIVIDKEIGWLPGPNLDILTVVADAGGEYYALRITSDENGFRHFGDVNSTDRPKVLFIGDSFTQAMEVSDNKTFYGIIREKMDIEVFSLGAGGYGTLQAYMLMNRWLDHIQPDIVVVQFSPNDIVNNSYELESQSIYNNNGMRRPYLRDGEIQYKLPKNMPRIRHFANRNSRFLYYILSRIDIMRSQYGIESIENDIYEKGREIQAYREAQEVTEEIFRMMNDSIDSIGAEFYTFSTDENMPYFEDYLDMVNRYPGIHLIDGVTVALREAEEMGVTIRASDMAHWNNEGHRIVAEVIADKLNATLFNNDD